MTAPFFHGSPRQQREAAFFDRMRASNEAFRRACQETLAVGRAEATERVAAFRATLKPESHGWFDGLSPADQVRVATPSRLDRRSEVQRDHDATDSAAGWPEN